MRAKLITLTVVLIAIAGALLALRQQRLHVSHQIAEEVRAAQASATRLWEAEAIAAHLLRPEALERRIDHAQLAVTRTPERIEGRREIQLVLLPDHWAEGRGRTDADRDARTSHR